MTWWQRLIRHNQLEAQLDKELRFHLEQHTADLIDQGHDPKEARRLAILALGGPEQVKEECRDARGTRWIEDVWHDFRYAARALRQHPAFSLVALVTLALGIGATTVMFTVINGVVLKPLPYADPGRLLNLREQTDWSNHWGNIWAFTYPNFQDCQREAQSLGMAAWRFSGGAVTASGEAEYVDGREISSGLLSLLGVPMSSGRAFEPDDDRPGAAPVAIISHAFWQRRFGANPGAIGASIVFDGKPYTVAGILPPGFKLGAGEAAVFTPLGQDTGPAMQNRGAHRLNVWARLLPGTQLSGAQAELTMVGRHLAGQFPQTNQGRTFVAQPLRPDVGDVQSTLWLLLGAVGLVLLIACANVASLLLARAVSRERELAMRIALGASRGRLVRQCLTESAVLGLLGGGLGVLLASAGIRPFVTFWPGSLPRADEVTLDWRVLLFAVAASLLSGLLFGLAPALRAPARDLEQALRAGGRTLAGSSRRLHAGFVTAQIALAVVLLVAAGMLGRTLLRLSSLDPGVNTRNVLTARMALSPQTLENPDRIRAAWQDILDRARRVPGVQAITMVDTVPMREGNNQIGYRTSAAAVPDNQLPLTLASSVTPGYLQVMGMRLLAGRFFDDQDRMGRESVAVIDDVMAREAFGKEDPIGKRVWIDLGADPARVIGVVNHVRHWGLAGDDQAKVRAQLYYPFAQVPDNLVRRWSELMSIAVRTNLAPMSVVEPLRREVRGATRDQVLYELNTLDQLASGTLAQQRFLMLLFTVFAALALLLACIGIYGVMAYLTGQRVPEIGVRMALGATSRDVLRLVLGQSIGMIAAGVAAGVAAALAAGRLLIHLVTGVEPAEPVTLGFVIFVLVGAALLASFLPARRASRVDSVQALRQE